MGERVWVWKKGGEKKKLGGRERDLCVVDWGNGKRIGGTKLRKLGFREKKCKKWNQEVGRKKKRFFFRKKKNGVRKKNSPFFLSIQFFISIYFSSTSYTGLGQEQICFKIFFYGAKTGSWYWVSPRERRARTRGKKGINAMEKEKWWINK